MDTRACLAYHYVGGMRNWKSGPLAALALESWGAGIQQCVGGHGGAGIGMGIAVWKKQAWPHGHIAVCTRGGMGICCQLIRTKFALNLFFTFSQPGPDLQSSFRPVRWSLCVNRIYIILLATKQAYTCIDGLCNSFFVKD